MSVVDTVDQRRATAVAAYAAVTRPVRELDDVVELAAQLAGTPHAAVNVFTADRQHQVATYGFTETACRREDAMCSVVLEERRPIAVPDARLDPRLWDKLAVTGERGAVRYWASVPLENADGVVFGTLCVFDEQPREVDPGVLRALGTLAARVVDVYELRLRSRELALSLLEQQALQADLERSNERLDGFAGQVSHDLKTPLTTLSLSLTLAREQLRSGELGVDTLHLIDRAIAGSQRMSLLIDDVLDYARLGGTLRATDVDLDFVMGEVLDDLGPYLDGVDLHLGRLPTVNGDRSQLRAVLQNLLANAVKYARPDRAPVVSVSARHVQRAWRIEVTDNGRGIAPSDRARIFEPLTRLDEAEASVEGSGIGLATCRRIIGAHGGRIGIDPTVTDGTRVWFELPD
ncbi:ATP-binding protein [Nocardioides flavescens]|uniref:Sensor-like histidine kinase SenX3 n=1 Tax=Nocardioides flavescens TaxID=2691959 RepID=A0A6L7F4L3_9ACTN|nr:GAF domain-containing protein [Nocardioides flavescens]